MQKIYSESKTHDHDFVDRKIQVTNEIMTIDPIGSHERRPVLNRFSTGRRNKSVLRVFDNTSLDISQSEPMVKALTEWLVDPGALYFQVQRLGVGRVEANIKFVSAKRFVDNPGAYLLVCLRGLKTG